MLRALVLATPLFFVPIAASAPAAAASASTIDAQSRDGRSCEEQRATGRNRGRRIGGALGGIAGRFGGRLGGAANVVSNFLPVTELLGEAIASMLDCDEQQKAAGATEEAVRGGVGTTTTWQSETRPGVTGSSTVTAAERSGDGECMTVTDIVIVDGEETRAPKRMCRRPPSTRYVRV
jgi:surface antigen